MPTPVKHRVVRGGWGPAYCRAALPVVPGLSCLHCPHHHTKHSLGLPVCCGPGARSPCTTTRHCTCLTRHPQGWGLLAPVGDTDTPLLSNYITYMLSNIQVTQYPRTTSSHVAVFPSSPRTPHALNPSEQEVYANARQETYRSRGTKRQQSQSTRSRPDTRGSQTVSSAVGGCCQMPKHKGQHT